MKGNRTAALGKLVHALGGKGNDMTTTGLERVLRTPSVDRDNVLRELLSKNHGSASLSLDDLFGEAGLPRFVSEMRSGKFKPAGGKPFRGFPANGKQQEAAMVGHLTDSTRDPITRAVGDWMGEGANTPAIGDRLSKILSSDKVPSWLSNAARTTRGQVADTYNRTVNPSARGQAGISALPALSMLAPTAVGAASADAIQQKVMGN